MERLIEDDRLHALGLATQAGELARQELRITEKILAHEHEEALKAIDNGVAQGHEDKVLASHCYRLVAIRQIWAKLIRTIDSGDDARHEAQQLVAEEHAREKQAP